MQNLKIFHNMNNMQNIHNWSKQSMLGSVVRLAMFILLTAGKSSGHCIAEENTFNCLQQVHEDGEQERAAECKDKNFLLYEII